MRELVVTELDAYLFAVELADLDLDPFDQLLERSGEAATREARRPVEESVALVRGEALKHDPYTSSAEALRGTYRGCVLGALLDAAPAALAECDYAAPCPMPSRPSALTGSPSAPTEPRYSPCCACPCPRGARPSFRPM